jgi:DNA helicase-2/ATP-dependent DNA helicase PcrA
MQLDLENNLNPAQLEAVTHARGPLLVIAGAGSGKTRTVVYRLAHLVNQGQPPESILLLTFTRKAAQEMLNRASHLLGQGLHGVSGGTFHSFAYSALRRYGQALGLRPDLTILDRGDAEDILAQVREAEGLAKGDRSFPKKGTVMSLISKSRNKELDLEHIIQKDSSHFLPYVEDLKRIEEAYHQFKLDYGLLDYDDLLFMFERLLTERDDLREFLGMRYTHLMVDEYQDTNLVQGRLVKLLAGEEGNVMAVGDDAQSIYSFRGATVSNILEFTRSFPGTKVVKLEQNYRSTQPILSLSNQILAGARQKYEKRLFSLQEEGLTPQLLRPLSDQSQAAVVMNTIMDLTRSFDLGDIAVLFRAGFQSYPLELALNKSGLDFQKFGGMRFTEAAHIKDVVAHLRLAANPTDLPAWQRAMGLVPGVGPKTCQNLYNHLVNQNLKALHKACGSKPGLQEALDMVNWLREHRSDPPQDIVDKIREYYGPRLKERYPDDYPRRENGLEQLSQIASGYSDLELFLSDLSLENPEQIGRRQVRENVLTLSTVHSAKGLEWSAVIVIDLVEDRFPSKHALMDMEGMEEERRLFYVACTRAKEYLGLSMPESLFNRFQGRSEPARPSPFVQEFAPGSYEELRENYTGGMVRPQEKKQGPEPAPAESEPGPVSSHCRHKVFGQGKVLSFIPPNKYKVNFPGFGLKVIIGDYLQFEEAG